MGTPVTTSKARRKFGSRGQSLTEFALLLPMILLLMLIAIDFGRVFLGWVGLNNAARVAANYAAMHPNPSDYGPGTPDRVEYERLINAETQKLSCTPSAIAAPTFPAGTQIGFPARAEITCQFAIITPIIGSILGPGLPVTASASFPIRFGSIGGVPADPVLPTPTPTPSPTPSPTPTPTPGPTPTPTPTPDPNATPTPTPTPSPTPTPNPFCTVPNLVGQQTNQAQRLWGQTGQGAGFATNVSFTPLVPPHYAIAWQSLSVGTQALCATAQIEVRSIAP